MADPTHFVPAQVFHPAEVIREELLARGWDLDTLTTRSLGEHPIDAASATRWGLERLGWDFYLAYSTTTDTSDFMRLGDDGAAKLERAFGISSTMWKRLETAWREATPEQRSPPPDMDEFLSAGFNEQIGAFVEKLDAANRAAPPSGGTEP